jgi:hypothetical protein
MRQNGEIRSGQRRTDRHLGKRERYRAGRPEPADTHSGTSSALALGSGKIELMAESVSITGEGPRLEGVLGPMAPAEEADVRRRVVEAGTRLAELARQLRGRVGWHNQGLELEWMASGQLSITTAVEVVDRDKNAIAFIIQLRPGWYFGELGDRASWVVELSIEADCLHAVDHKAMETVYDSEIVAHSPTEAAETLAREVDRLIELATAHPLEHWTAQTRD